MDRPGLYRMLAFGKAVCLICWARRVNFLRARSEQVRPRPSGHFGADRADMISNTAAMMFLNHENRKLNALLLEQNLISSSSRSSTCCCATTKASNILGDGDPTITGRS